jgi:hypothetical protein
MESKPSKETAPWMREAAKEIWRRFAATFPEVEPASEIGFDKPIAQIIAKHAVECTAQAPTRLERPLTIDAIQEIVTECGKQKSEAESLRTESVRLRDALDTIIAKCSPSPKTGYHRRLCDIFGELLDIATEAKRAATPQGTPTDLLAVIERLANHGSVEDYTVEGIRAELREALHTFRPQGTPAPDEQEELAIYEQHIAELTARQKKPLSQQDRMWINGYRQGWLACLTRKRPTATPQGTPSECPQCGSKDFWTVLPACHGGKAHKWHKEK